jgi:hypothetical protein
LVLQGTTCQAACNAGFVAVNGVCQVDCAGVGQNASIERPCCVGLVNQNGVCQTACSSGYSPTNGVCVPICGAANQPPHPTYGCCNGLFVENGLCVSSCSNGFAPNAQGVCTPLCSSAGTAPHPTYGCCAGLVIQDGVCQTQCNAGYANYNGVCLNCTPDLQAPISPETIYTKPCCEGLQFVNTSPNGSVLPNEGTGWIGAVCRSCLQENYPSRPINFTSISNSLYNPAINNWYNLPCCTGLHRYGAFNENSILRSFCVSTCGQINIGTEASPNFYQSEPYYDINDPFTSAGGSMCVPCGVNGQAPFFWNGINRCCAGFVYNPSTQLCELA